MQIRMYTENSFNVSVGRVSQAKQQSAQMSGGVFDGPQCKVTISKEGRKLSEQSDRQPARSAQSLKVEKLMLRQCKETEQADETQDEYMALLEEINKSIKSMNNSYQAGADKETIEKKQQVMRAIREQKQKQLEENQRKAKEAQQMAMQSSEIQDEVDKNNRDLLVMLKSIEESEKTEEENEHKGGNAEESSNGAQSENGVSDRIHNSAAQFTASSAKREMDVVGMIHALNEEGHVYLDKADEIVQNALEEAEDLKAFLADGNAVDAEKEEAVSRYREKVMAGYSDLSAYRRRGLQMIRDSKECRIEHIKYNPLQGMEETKDSMMQSAVDAAFNEATQGKLDETSQELEDAVEELIDERNDMDHVEEPEEEEQKEIEELLGTKEQSEDAEENLKAVYQA